MSSVVGEICDRARIHANKMRKVQCFELDYYDFKRLRWVVVAAVSRILPGSFGG